MVYHKALKADNKSRPQLQNTKQIEINELIWSEKKKDNTYQTNKEQSKREWK